jgi:hypothetical protein
MHFSVRPCVLLSADVFTCVIVDASRPRTAAPSYFQSANGQRDLVRIRAFVRRDLTAVLPVPDVGFWEELVLATLSRYAYRHQPSEITCIYILIFSTGILTP